MCSVDRPCWNRTQESCVALTDRVGTGPRSCVQRLPTVLEQVPAGLQKVNRWTIQGTVGGGDWVMEPLHPPSSPPPSCHRYTPCGGRMGGKPYILITCWRWWCAAVCVKVPGTLINSPQLQREVNLRSLSFTLILPFLLECKLGIDE